MYVLVQRSQEGQVEEEKAGRETSTDPVGSGRQTQRGLATQRVTVETLAISLHRNLSLSVRKLSVKGERRV